jgi:hypothetical protein
VVGRVTLLLAIAHIPSHLLLLPLLLLRGLLPVPTTLLLRLSLIPRPCLLLPVSCLLLPIASLLLPVATLLLPITPLLLPVPLLRLLLLLLHATIVVPLLHLTIAPDVSVATTPTPTPTPAATPTPASTTQEVLLAVIPAIPCIAAVPNPATTRSLWRPPGRLLLLLVLLLLLLPPVQLLPVCQPLGHKVRGVGLIALLCPVVTPTVPAGGPWGVLWAGPAAQVALVATYEAAGHADVCLAVVIGAAALIPVWVYGWAGGW